MAQSENIDLMYNRTLILQAILSAATVALSYLLFCRYLSLWASLIGTFLIIISPHLIVYSGYFLTETLFTFLLVLGFLLYSICTTRSSIFWGVATGVIWSLVCLTRPAFLLFPLVLFAYWMLFGRDTKKNMKVHLAVLAGFLIFWTPWQIYSHDKLKKYSPSAVSFALGGYPDLIYKSEKLKGYPYREDPRYGEMSESLSSAMKVVWERAKEKENLFCIGMLMSR